MYTLCLLRKHRCGAFTLFLVNNLALDVIPPPPRNSTRLRFATPSSGLVRLVTYLRFKCSYWDHCLGVSCCFWEDNAIFSLDYFSDPIYSVMG